MLILDRFEENIAIIERTDDETGTITMIKTERSFVSFETKEGDVLICEEGIYKTDYESTLQRRKMINERLKQIKK